MPVESPCVRNCCLDKKDVCIGCGRTVEEIIRWSEVSDKEKLKILAAAEKRKVNMEIFNCGCYQHIGDNE